MKSLAVALLELRRSINIDRKVSVPRALSRAHPGLTKAHWVIVEWMTSSVDLSDMPDDELVDRLALAVAKAKSQFVCVAASHHEFCTYLMRQPLLDMKMSPFLVDKVLAALPQWMMPDAVPLWMNDLRHTYLTLDPLDGDDDRLIYLKRESAF